MSDSGEPSIVGEMLYAQYSAVPRLDEMAMTPDDWAEILLQVQAEVSEAEFAQGWAELCEFVRRKALH